MFFRCVNCGGCVVYNPKTKRMYCPHCEGEDCGEQKMQGTMEVCTNCGAPIEVGQYTSASKCEYCDTYLIHEERIQGLYKPHLILPFMIDKDEAVKRLDNEFAKRVFAPSTFLTEKTLEHMEGSYVPFWLYDYKSSVVYRGEGSKVRRWRKGNTEYVETSIYAVERDFTAEFDKIPADASYAMPDDVMDLLEPYDYRELISFEPMYMSGFLAEYYNMTAKEIERRAQEKAGHACNGLLQESITGYDSIREIRRDINLNLEQINFALMPVYIYNYSYGGKVYSYHVNGQTGKVIGKTPISVPKVLIYGFALFGILAAAAEMIGSILEVL